MTLVNLSHVVAKVVLDLRENGDDSNTNGIDCLEIEPLYS